MEDANRNERGIKWRRKDNIERCIDLEWRWLNDDREESCTCLYKKQTWFFLFQNKTNLSATIFEYWLRRSSWYGTVVNNTYIDDYNERNIWVFLFVKINSNSIGGCYWSNKIDDRWRIEIWSNNRLKISQWENVLIKKNLEIKSSIVWFTNEKLPC